MAHNKLYRNFIILQEDERLKDKLEEKNLSGYAKIEAKGDKCKVSFYAQNLIEKKKYSIVLICNKKDCKQIVELGSILGSKSGKGEACKEYNINDIAGLNFSFDIISGAGISTGDKDNIKFILYGFMNGEKIEDDWKKYKILKSATEGNKIQKEKYDSKKSDDKEKYKKHEKDYDSNDKYNKDEKNDHAKHKADVECCKDDQKHKQVEEKSYDDKKHKEHEEKCDDDKKHKEHEEKCDDDKKHKDHKEKCDDDKKHKKHEEKCDSNEKYQKNKDDHKKHDGCEKCDRKENIDFESYESRLDEEALIDPYEFNLRGTLGKYFEDIVKEFDQIKIKSKEIKYCKWYKVKISSIDDMCNISNYNKYTIAYFPMINNYPYIKKYGHFILGYKCDDKGNLKHIVYGVPGKKNIDEQPYGGKTGFVTWMKSDDNGIGYWLMFYDYKTSTIVVPME